MGRALKPYLDAGFLLALLGRRPGSAKANELARRFPAPFRLTWLHAAQIEWGLRAGLKSSDSHRSAWAKEALNTWQRWTLEAVLVVEDSDWPASFVRAVELSRACPARSLFLLLHPALAGRNEFTHFLSFDPQARSAALVEGLKLLPAALD